ncbi:MAG: ankyrin repeat domain-containing protein [Candidatus Babeliales bacterium]|jgi:ankyrin repeat protein
MMSINETFAFTVVALFASLSAAIEPGEIPPPAFAEQPQNPYLALSEKEKDAGLLDAVSQGDVEKACYFIEAGADINLSGRNPLALAAARNDITMAKMLLDAGAYDCTDALVRAAEVGATQIVEMIIDAGTGHSEDFDEALKLARQNGHNDTAQVIIDTQIIFDKGGLSPENYQKLFQKDIKHYRHILQASEREKEKFLIQAVLNNNIEDVKFLLEVAKANPNAIGTFKSNSLFVKDGVTATDESLAHAPVLMLAAECGRTEIVRLLLQAHADPNIPTQLTSLPDYTTTALMVAIVRQDAEIIKMLKEAGAQEKLFVERMLYMSLPILV